MLGGAGGRGGRNAISAVSKISCAAAGISVFLAYVPLLCGEHSATLLMLPTWMYATSPDSLYVNLYVGSTVDVPNVAGTDLQLTQKTNYPWDGKVALTVTPKESKKFAIRIRVPQRGVSELYTSTPKADGNVVAGHQRRGHEARD